MVRRGLAHWSQWPFSSPTTVNASTLSMKYLHKSIHRSLAMHKRGLHSGTCTFTHLQQFLCPMMQLSRLGSCCSRLLCSPPPKGDEGALLHLLVVTTVYFVVFSLKFILVFVSIIFVIDTPGDCLFIGVLSSLCNAKSFEAVLTTVSVAVISSIIACTWFILYSLVSVKSKGLCARGASTSVRKLSYSPKLKTNYWYYILGWK